MVTAASANSNIRMQSKYEWKTSRCTLLGWSVCTCKSLGRQTQGTTYWWWIGPWSWECLSVGIVKLWPIDLMGVSQWGMPNWYLGPANRNVRNTGKRLINKDWIVALTSWCTGSIYFDGKCHSAGPKKCSSRPVCYLAVLVERTQCSFWIYTLK